MSGAGGSGGAFTNAGTITPRNADTSMLTHPAGDIVPGADTFVRFAAMSRIEDNRQQQLSPPEASQPRRRRAPWTVEPLSRVILPQSLANGPERGVAVNLHRRPADHSSWADALTVRHSGAPLIGGRNGQPGLVCRP